jgi:uncharacterized protein (DUF1697 family)
MVTRWIALLRGVNVGGGNKIAMPALRASCEAHGFDGVATYIQSGNLVFESTGDEATVTSALREILREQHALKVPVVVRSAREMARVPDRHPGLAAQIDPKYLHVHFLDRKVDRADVAKVDPAPFDPDTFLIDGRHIYVTYPNGSGRSKLTIEVFERALGVTSTARNLNTVRALIALASG